MTKKDQNVAEPIVSQKKRGIALSRRLVFAVILAVIVLLAAAATIPTTRHFFTRQIGDTAFLKAKMCSDNDALITRYNSVVKKDGVTGLTAIAKDVRALPNYATDPTCAYIVTIADYGSNASTSQESYEHLIALKAAGKDVSGKVDDGLDRESIYRLMQQQIDDKAKGYYGQG